MYVATKKFSAKIKQQDKVICSVSFHNISTPYASCSTILTLILL